MTSTTITRTTSRPVLLAASAFGLVSLVHLIAQLCGGDDLANVTQWFLMPLLALALALAVPAPRSRLVNLTLVALGLSWLGDSAPDLFDSDSDAAFLAMIGFFLLAQIAYIAAFRPYLDESVARRPIVAAYVVAIIALVAACAPGAGVMLAPAFIYGVCLGTMAVLSTGIGRIAGIGGALFLLSDAMIALDAFADWFNPPGQGFVVMLTYIAGQALLAYGVWKRSAPVSG